MRDFAYHRPSTIAAAVAAMETAEDGRFIAGGMSLVPSLKLGLASPTDLIDLAGLAELGAPAGIRLRGEALTIGALVTHVEVADSASAQAAIPALAELAGRIGDAQVRNRGTIGGSLANNDPAADYPAALLALGATIRTDRRAIAADDFFTGMFATALEKSEIVVAVDFPLPEKARYLKFPNPASRFALVGVMVAKGPAGVRVAVTGAGPCAFRVREMEQALARRFAADVLADVRVPADDLLSDLHGDAAYRSHLVSVLARRAVAAIR